VTVHHLTEDEFRTAVGLAIRAPSLHNSQPWRFRRIGDTVEVRADPARRLPIADPTGQAVRLACGAAILNLRLVFATAGHPVRVDLLPDRTDPDLLARLDPAASRPASPEDAALAAVIGKRHSNREPFLDAPVPASHRTAIAAAARAESAVLTFVTDRSDIAEVAELIRRADQTLRARPAYLDELRSWTRPDEGADDGVPRRAGGPALAPHELLARREFGGPPAPAHRRFEAEPLLSLLGSFGDTHYDQLVAGQALQRVLLTVTRLGLVASLLSQPIEVAETRDGLQAMLGAATAPQMVMRMGFGVPGSATPRRRVEEVIDHVEAQSEGR